jgi:hypothetical protein
MTPSPLSLLDLGVKRVMCPSKVCLQKCIHLTSVPYILISGLMCVLWLVCVSTARICGISTSAKVLLRRGRWIR